MAADPWFTHWNYNFFVFLFRYLSHRASTDDFCDLLISNPLLSTWVFAAVFYGFWIKDDEHKARRRSYLISAVFAFVFACIVTLVLRPWVHWPAPVLHPGFQSLFPSYRWGAGSTNCFPSHSTLTYFMMAVGLWPLNRRLSIWLSIMALLFISLPRVYAGGHYPIDVLFSCALGILALALVWRWFTPAVASVVIAATQKAEAIGNLIVFFWVFELGEGFRGLESLASLVHHLHFGP